MNSIEDTNIKNPFLINTVSDYNGNWEINIQNFLLPGEHKIKTITKDTHGDLVEQNIATLLVKGDGETIFQNNVQNNYLTNGFVVLLTFFYLVLTVISVYKFFTCLLVNKKITNKFIKFFKKIFFLSLIPVWFVCIFYLINIYSNKNIENFETTDISMNVPSFTGRVVDTVTEEPIKNLTLSIGNKSVLTNEKGEFVFNNVNSSDKLIISGAGIYDRVFINLGEENNVDIKLNLSLAAFLENFNFDYKHNKFKGIYKSMFPELKNIISEKDFLELQNLKLKSRINNYKKVLDSNFLKNFKNIENWESENTNLEFDSVIEVVNEFLFLNYDNDIEKKEEKWFFVETTEGWFFVQ